MGQLGLNARLLALAMGCLAAFAMEFSPIEAASSDRTLVPLELPGRESLGKILSGIERIEAGNFEAGIRLLQECVAEGFRWKYRRVLSPADSPLVAVPPELPRELAALRKALEEASRPAATLPPRAAGLQGRVRQRVLLGPGGDVVDVQVVPKKEETSSPGRRFLPPSVVAEFALSCMPPLGLKTYRALYDADALRCLESYRKGGDRSGLERLASEFFLSTYGADGAEALGDESFEEGEVSAALSWWRKALEHPELSGSERRVRAKVLAALRMLGRAKEAELEASRLGLPLSGPAAPERQAEWGVSFPELVPLDERPKPSTASRWGTEIQPGELPKLPGLRLELSWDSWIWSVRGLGLSRSNLAGRREVAGYGFSYVHFPFVLTPDEDFVYLSSVFSAYKIDARPGRGNVVREYRKPFSRDLAGYSEETDSALYTVTLWKKRWEPRCAFGALPDEILIAPYVADLVRPVDYRSYDLTVQIPIRGLVAFDAQSGAILWTAGAAESRKPEEKAERGEPWRSQRPERLDPLSTTETAAVKDFSYTSPAIVKRGLVIAAGWVQRGYVSVALRAHDLRTGTLVWETPIVNSGSIERTLFGEMAREPFAPVLFEQDGVVYCVTQLGAIAAADLWTGRVLWASTYDAIPVLPTFGPRAILRDVVWGPNPILLLGPVLIATPRDSGALYAVDTGQGPCGPVTAGRTLWKFSAAGWEDDAYRPRDLLGYRRGRLYLGGYAEISALDLSSMDGEGFLRSHGRVLSSPPVRKLAPRTTIRIEAPAALVREGIVFADADGLKLLEFDTEKILELARLSAGPAEWASYKGRVQICSNAVLVTSRYSISGFAPVVRALSEQ